MLNCIAAKLNWFTAFCNFIKIVRDQNFNFIMSGNCIDHIPYIEIPHKDGKDGSNSIQLKNLMF